MTSYQSSQDKETSLRSLNGLAALAPTIALSCALPIAFAATEPFFFGLWRSAEPLVVAFHASAGVGTLALFIVGLRDVDRLEAALKHPFVVIPTLLCVWSLLASVFARFPILGVLGAPQSGEGAIWFANLAVLTACGLLVAERPAHWRWLAVLATAVVVAIVVTKRMTPFGSYQIFWINDLVAFLALALPVIALRHTGGGWIWVLGGAVIAGIGLLFVSQNLAAMVVVAAGAATVAISAPIRRFGRIASFLDTPWFGMSVVVALGLVPLFFIETGLWIDQVPSLRSRHLVAEVMGAGQSFDVKSLLVGNGWGHTQAALVENLNAAGQSLWNIRWDFLEANYSHSHNWVIEYLFVLGLPGVILALAYYVAAPRYARRGSRLLAAVFAGGCAALSSVWFQMAFFVPYLALAMASLARGVQRPSVARGRAPAALLFGLTLVFVVQIAASSVLLDFGRRVTAATVSLNDPPEDATTFSFPIDFRGAEYAFAMSVRNYVSMLSKKSWQGLESSKERHRSLLIRLIEELKGRIARTDSTFLLVAAVSAFSEVMYSPGLAWLKADLAPRAAVWGEWVERVLFLVPQRSDLAIGYFAWLLENRDSSTLVRIATNAMSRRQDDPVALYYLGAATLLDGRPESRALGLSYLRQGIEKGIELYMPIDPALKDLIGHRQ